MRQLMTVLLLLAGCLLLADGVQPGGDGSYLEPYEVETLDNLLWVSTNPGSWNSHFIQTADIDAYDTRDWNGGQGFLPIAPTSNPYFMGTYDGQGYKISNIYMYRPETIRQSLFGSTHYATISNVNMENVDITGLNNAAPVVSYCTNTNVQNGWCSGKVVGYVSGASGVVGYLRDGSSVTECYT